MGTETRFLDMGEDVHSCMALTSNDKLCTVRNSDKIYSFEVVCDYVSLMFRRQRCDFGSNEVAFQFFESVVPVQEVAEDIPVTELDNSSSSEEQPLPPAVDFSLTFSPKQWSHWIDMFSSESSQILNDSFCEEDDSPRTQQLKKAVQSQFFVKSLFPVEQKKRKRDNSKTSSPRIFGWTKWGRCDMCFNCLKPCVIWSGPLEGYPVLRCVGRKDRPQKCSFTKRFTEDRIPTLPINILHAINILRSSPRFQARHPGRQVFFPLPDHARDTEG